MCELFTLNRKWLKSLWILLFLSPLLAIANHDGHNHNGEQCATKTPDVQWEANFQNMLLQTRQKLLTQKQDQTFVIPVIVHIVHSGTAVGSGFNISAAQVQSQIDILNKDYAGTGLNVGNVPAVFKDLVANTGINFCLAQKAPDGSQLSEPGIDRIKATDKGWRNPGSAGYTTEYMDSVIKPQSYWDPSLYLNIWVTKLEFGLLGYATFPNFSTLDGLPGFWAEDSRDGVAISYTSFGSGGVTQAPYNQGRTASHEIGHWLGLRHLWGDDQNLTDKCSGSDFCDDTPNQTVASSGCPNFPTRSCSNSGNMTMNFMDYSNDACAYMFTLGQKERMLTTLTNSPNRIKLLSSPVCQTTALAPVAKFKPNKESICAGESVTFNDVSLFTPTSWQWSFPGGNPSTSTSKNPTVAYATPGVYPVTLTVTNGGGSNTITLKYTVIPTLGVPYFQDFEGVDTTFPPYGWSLFTRNTKGVNWNPTSRASGFAQGKFCIYFDNTNIDVTNFADDIRTPYLNLSGTAEPKLVFDVAHAPYTDLAYQDGLEVLVSLNCGQSFTSLYKKIGSQLATAPAVGEDWEPKLASEWRRDTVDLKAFAGQPKVMIVIRNLAKYGHSTFIDNVLVKDFKVAAPPDVSDVTVNNASVCAGESVTFTAQTSGSPTQYVWTLNGITPTVYNTTVPTLTVQYAAAGKFNVKVKVINDAGSDSLTKSSIVTVNAVPNVSVNSPSVCNGASVTLTATGAASYVWNTGASDASINVSPSSATTYTVIGTTAGCKDTATSTVSVNNPPIVSANSGTVCSGTSITLTAAGASSYIWNTGANTASINVSPSVNTTYTVIGTDANGCKDTAQSVVTIFNEAPTVTVNSASICVGDSVVLTASGAATYSWEGGPTTASITVKPSTTTSYNVTGSNGCKEASATATVTVKSKPELTVIDASACEGESATLTVSGADTYVWEGGSSGDSYSSTASGIKVITVTGTKDGCSTVATGTITAIALPSTPIISRVGDVLYTTGTPDFQWFLNSSAIEGATLDSLIISATGDYTVKSKDAATDCASTSTVFTVINLGIKNSLKDVSVRLYPNPSKGNFVLDMNSTVSGAYTLMLMNSTGQIISSKMFNLQTGNQKLEVDMNGTANGVYFLQLTGPAGSLVVSAVLQQ